MCAAYCLHAATSASAESITPLSSIFLERAERSLYGAMSALGIGRQR